VRLNSDNSTILYCENNLKKELEPSKTRNKQKYEQHFCITILMVFYLSSLFVYRAVPSFYVASRTNMWRTIFSMNANPTEEEILGVIQPVLPPLQLHTV
jgi:hypothetical protein